MAAHMANKIELLVQVVGQAHEPAKSFASISRSHFVIFCVQCLGKPVQISLACSPKPPSNALAKPEAKLLMRMTFN